MRKFYCFLMAIFAITSLCAQSGGSKFTWLDDQEGAFFEVNAFSDNKEFAVGKGTGRAFVYNLKSGKFTYLSEEGIPSNAWDVSDEGIVVGCSGDDMTSQACYWDKDGKMTILFPDDVKWSVAKGITPTGNLIVGHTTNKDDDPNPQVSSPFYWILGSDNVYAMNPLQEPVDEDFAAPVAGSFIRGIGADGTILAGVQVENGELPLVYYKSYSEKPVYFAKDSLKTFNPETFEYEGDEPFIYCTGEEISEDGKWICCTVVRLIEDGGRPLQYYFPSAYNIAENKFYTSPNVVLQVEREPAGGVIDNNGNMFSTLSGMDPMLGRTIVYIKKGESGATKIDDYLKELGVDSEPFAESGAVTAMALSGDGKMLGGFALQEVGRLGWISDVDGTLVVPQIPTSITDVKHNLGLSCYVSDNTLYIGNEVREVALYSVSGEQVLSAKVNGNSIRLDNMTSGVYMVKLIADGETSVLKVIVK